MPGGLFCAIGNPLNDGTWTYTWQNGRQLARMQSIDTDASFIYNENGLRVQKTVNGVVTNYTLHGKSIHHMTQGNNELHFFYDAQNKPAVVVYNDTPYSYVKNLQGDIVAILNSTGIAVVNYVYDAWGRPISKTGSMADTLGSVQPFRYRGYVYDEEIELYYLRNRFYTPFGGRFINLDIFVGKTGRTGEHNIYSYCKNSPLIASDEDGLFLGALIGGVCGALFSGIDALVSGDDVLSAMGAGFVSGAVAGLAVDAAVSIAAIGTPLALVGAVGIAFAGGAVGSTLSYVMTNDEIDWKDLAATALFGGVSNVTCFCLTFAISYRTLRTPQNTGHTSGVFSGNMHDAGYAGTSYWNGANLQSQAFMTSVKVNTFASCVAGTQGLMMTWSWRKSKELLDDFYEDENDPKLVLPSPAIH